MTFSRMTKDYEVEFDYTTGKYEVIAPMWLNDNSRSNTFLWGVKKSDGTVLIDPDYYLENAISKLTWILTRKLNSKYKTVEEIASRVNWLVVEEKR